MGPILKDDSWVRQAFLIENSAMDSVDFQNRTFSSASLKFTDTTPGGNFAINPPPQFTRSADIKSESRFSDGRGMGRYYSEAIDDNSQIIHMRFGTPQFNSLTTFFTGFYNTGAGQLARTGRATNAFYYLGRAAGFIVSIISWKLLAVHLLGVGLRFAMQKPSSKFYYLRPAMPLYWNAVTTMVNQIAVNRGIVPRIGGKSQEKYSDKYEFDQSAIKRLNEMMPDVFKMGGGIDVYAMAGRAQRLARKQHKKMAAEMDAATDMNLKDRMDALSKHIQAVNSGEKLQDDQRPVFSSGDAAKPGYLEKWLSSAASVPKAAKEGSDDFSSTTESIPKKDEEPPPGFFDFLAGELDDGSAFASFRVNSTGHVSESFSNSVMDSELQGKINGMSSQSRSTNFSLAGGNLDDGIIGKVLGGIATAVKDVASGVMDQLSISGLAALGGSAFVDIPKHWHSSSAQLPRASYTISLVSPYGNPISQLTNIHIPLAMLLAGALPLSTGKQSYTSPFLVELYDKGRCQTRLGMIDSLSITRGTGNMGFDNDGHAMAIDVSFSVIDMSSILHMPIAQGFTMNATAAGATVGTVVGGVAGAPGGPVGVVGGAAAGAAVGAAVGGTVDAVNNALTAVAGVFDDDTAFTDYMAVISGMGLADQIYSVRKLKLNLTKTVANWNSWYSTSHYASFVGDTMPARMVSALFKGTAR